MSYHIYVVYLVYLHCEIQHKSPYNVRFGPGKVLEKSLVLIHQNLWEPCYLNQCWVVVNSNLRNKLWVKFKQNSKKFYFKKMHLKMLSGKWRPFCLELNVLTLQHVWPTSINASPELNSFIKRHPLYCNHQQTMGCLFWAFWTWTWTWTWTWCTEDARPYLTHTDELWGAYCDDPIAACQTPICGHKLWPTSLERRRIVRRKSWRCWLTSTVGTFCHRY